MDEQGKVGGFAVEGRDFEAEWVFLHRLKGRLTEERTLALAKVRGLTLEIEDTEAKIAEVRAALLAEL